MDLDLQITWKHPVALTVLVLAGDAPLPRPLHLSLLPLRGGGQHLAHGDLHRHRQLHPGKPHRLPLPAQPDHGKLQIFL